MDVKGVFSNPSELLDVFQLVRMAKKEGEFRIVAPNGEAISFMFKSGKVVAVDTNVPILRSALRMTQRLRIPLGELLKNCLHYMTVFWDSGSFELREGEVNQEEVSDVADIVNTTIDFIRERDEVQPLIDRFMEYKSNAVLSEDLELEKVAISRGAWNVVVHVAYNNTPMNKIIFLGFPFGETLKNLNFMLKHGLIRAVGEGEEGAKKFIPEGDFIPLKEIMVEILGPMGPVILEEILGKHKTEEGIPCNTLDKIEKDILDEIPISCFIGEKNCRQLIKDEFEKLKDKCGGQR